MGSGETLEKYSVASVRHLDERMSFVAPGVQERDYSRRKAGVISDVRLEAPWMVGKRGVPRERKNSDDVEELLGVGGVKIDAKGQRKS